MQHCTTMLNHYYARSIKAVGAVRILSVTISIVQHRTNEKLDHLHWRFKPQLSSGQMLNVHTYIEQEKRLRKDL